MGRMIVPGMLGCTAAFSSGPTFLARIVVAFRRGEP